MPPRIHVGEQGNPQRRRMRRHVQPICQQGHRTKHDPRRDFHDHHRGRNNDDPESTSLPLALRVLSEHVIVSQPINLFVAHGLFIRHARIGNDRPLKRNLLFDQPAGRTARALAIRHADEGIAMNDRCLARPDASGN